MSKLVVIRNKKVVASHDHGTRSFLNMIADSAVAGPRFSRWGTKPKKEGTNLYFWQIFPENCMKMNANWIERGCGSLRPPPPLDPPMQCQNVEELIVWCASILSNPLLLFYFCIELNMHLCRRQLHCTHGPIGFGPRAKRPPEFNINCELHKGD